LTAQVQNKTECTCHLYTYNVHRWWTPLVCNWRNFIVHLEGNLYQWTSLQ
jgi:hypothetical protein